MVKEKKWNKILEGRCNKEYSDIDCDNQTNIESPRQQILNSKNKNETSETDLRQLNFHHQDIPWKRINQIIKEIKWNEIFEGRCNEECTDIFIAIIKQLCLMLIPKKSSK